VRDLDRGVAVLARDPREESRRSFVGDLVRRGLREQSEAAGEVANAAHRHGGHEATRGRTCDLGDERCHWARVYPDD
jgi:hypothetical protein